MTKGGADTADCSKPPHRAGWHIMGAMKLYPTPEEYYVARCLELAELAKGETSPNPLVGAIVLDAQGKKVAEGVHTKAGGPHAEVIALNQAGNLAEGGTLIVNLEPCSHTGKTPPCTDRILQAGIKQVICGTLDPNPLVSGSGRDFLQNSMISVRAGFLEDECQKLNEVFFHYITRKTPFVTVKHGTTLNGKIADRQGNSQWITRPMSRRLVHLYRSQSDAILTTARTVQQDNCRLTVREAPKNRHAPVRIILDRRFTLNPQEYEIFNTAEAPTWVFTSLLQHNKAHAEAAKLKGCRVFPVDEDGSRLNLLEVMKTLGQEEITHLMVEAGGTLSGDLLAKGLINKWLLFVSGKLLPDPQAVPFIESPHLFGLDNAPSLSISHIQRLDQDYLVEAYPAS